MHMLRVKVGEFQCRSQVRGHCSNFAVVIRQPRLHEQAISQPRDVRVSLDSNTGGLAVKTIAVYINFKFFIVSIKSSLVRWPRYVVRFLRRLIIRSQSHSWLWRQVKVNLNTYSWSRKWRGFESHSHQHSSGFSQIPQVSFLLL